jgi:hypothetical protein
MTIDEIVKKTNSTHVWLDTPDVWLDSYLGGSTVWNATAWILQESRKLEATWPKGTPVEQQVLASWRSQRPNMMIVIGEDTALALAHVLVRHRHEREQAFQEQGMSSQDAAARADREWPLMEPEDDTVDPDDPLGVTKPISPEELAWRAYMRRLGRRFVEECSASALWREKFEETGIEGYLEGHNPSGVR